MEKTQRDIQFDDAALEMQRAALDVRAKYNLSLAEFVAIVSTLLRDAAKPGVTRSRGRKVDVKD